jgi:hypothetical protein
MGEEREAVRTYRLPERDSGGDQYLDVTVTYDPYGDPTTDVYTVFAWGHPVVTLRPGTHEHPDSTRFRDLVANLLLEIGAVTEEGQQTFVKTLGTADEQTAFNHLVEYQDEHAFTDWIQNLEDRIAELEQRREERLEHGEYVTHLAEQLAQEIQDVSAGRPAVGSDPTTFRILADEVTDSAWVVEVRTDYWERGDR